MKQDRKMKGKKAQLGATLTMMVATFIVIAIFFVLFVVSQAVGKLKFGKAAKAEVLSFSYEQQSVSLREWLRSPISIDGKDTSIAELIAAAHHEKDSEKKDSYIRVIKESASKTIEQLYHGQISYAIEIQDLGILPQTTTTAPPGAPQESVSGLARVIATANVPTFDGFIEVKLGVVPKRK